MPKFLGLCLALTFVVLTGPMSAADAAGAGQKCGGILGIVCGRGLWCEPPTGACHAPDIEGKCVRVPQICSKIFLPVCGCNGKTYGNDCERLHAKETKAHDGPC